MGRPRKKLEASDITAVIDNREQRPWGLAPLKTIKGTLTTGDYSVLGLEHEIAIERKSLDDLLGCIGQRRDEFDRCIKRMLAYPVRAVIVEASWFQLEQGGWRSHITTAAAMGSVCGWIAAGIPFVFAGDAEKASIAAARILFIAARPWSGPRARE